MVWFVLLVSVFTLTTSEAVYVWTEWSQESKCLRSCSKPVGMELFLRKCMNCVGQYCKPVDTLYCGGDSKKVLPCYVGSQCSGVGSYRGEWTAWSRLDVCPPARHRCKGKYLVSFRRCILPAAYRGRLMMFRCPGYQLVRKVERCPCEVSAWSEWSLWTICSPAGGGQRTRRRVCIRQTYGQCIGGYLQGAPCPVGGALSAGGPPRVRKIRSDPKADKIKSEYVQVDWEKEPLTNMPPWLIPAGIGGLVGIVFIISLCLVVVKIRRRKKAAKKAKKAKEASANPDELPLLSGATAPKKGSALSSPATTVSPAVTDDSSSSSSSSDEGKSGKSSKHRQEKGDKSKKGHRPKGASKQKEGEKQKTATPPPAQQTPAQQTPAQQTPAQQTPAQQTPAQQTPAQPRPTAPSPGQHRPPAPAQHRPPAPAQHRPPAPAQQTQAAPGPRSAPPKKPAHQTPPSGAPPPATAPATPQPSAPQNPPTPGQ